MKWPVHHHIYVYSVAVVVTRDSSQHKA